MKNFGKKLSAVLLISALICGFAFGLVACNDHTTETLSRSAAIAMLKPLSDNLNGLSDYNEVFKITTLRGGNTEVIDADISSKDHPERHRTELLGKIVTGRDVKEFYLGFPIVTKNDDGKYVYQTDPTEYYITYEVGEDISGIEKVSNTLKANEFSAALNETQIMYVFQIIENVYRSVDDDTYVSVVATYKNQKLQYYNMNVNGEYSYDKGTYKYNVHLELDASGIYVRNAVITLKDEANDLEIGVDATFRYGKFFNTVDYAWPDSVYQQ